MKRAVRILVEEYRSEVLMWSLVAAMLASPLVDRDRSIGGLLAIVQLVLLFVGASYLANRRIVRRVVVPVAVLWFASRLLEAFGDINRSYAHFAPIAGLALSCTVLWALLDRFGSISRVTRSVISEAVISYLVIAIAYSQLYWLLDHFVSNAFSRTIPFGQSGTFLYFSMITLSGLGDGSIFPTNPYVRLVAAFENMTGLFFLAVVVARLVSSYRARPHHLRDDDESAKSKD
jgi:Ion channel